MSKRDVEIPVERKIQDLIKEAKGHLTYSEFFSNIMKLK